MCNIFNTKNSTRVVGSNHFLRVLVSKDSHAVLASLVKSIPLSECFVSEHCNSLFFLFVCQANLENLKGKGMLALSRLECVLIDADSSPPSLSVQISQYFGFCLTVRVAFIYLLFLFFCLSLFVAVSRVYLFACAVCVGRGSPRLSSAGLFSVSLQ